MSVATVVTAIRIHSCGRESPEILNLLPVCGNVKHAAQHMVSDGCPITSSSVEFRCPARLGGVLERLTALLRRRTCRVVCIYSLEVVQ